MSKHTQLDFQNFLQNAAKLSLKELEIFVKELNAVIQKKKQKDKKYKEKTLLSQLNQLTLNKQQQERYHLLSEKLEMETITAKEQKEYTTLINVDEELRNKRVAILIELAQLKSLTLSALMKDLGLNFVKRAYA